MRYLIGLTTLLLGACASTPSPQLATKWANAIEELQIHAIFPPRSDVHVGDVYILPLKTDIHPDDMALGEYIQSYSFWPELQAYYDSRPYFTQPDNPATTLRLKGHEFSIPLKLLAFPGFITTRSNTANLAGLLPYGALKTQLAAGYNKNGKTDVQIQSASYYGLPIQTLEKKFPLSTAAQLLEHRYPQGFKEAKSLVVVMVAEVYYTNHFNVTLHDNFTAGANTTVQANKATPGTAPQAAGLTELTEAGTDPGSTDTDAQEPSQELASLSSPGLTAKVVSQNTSAISLSYKTDTPVAIGYRRLQYLFHYDPASKRFMPEQTGIRQSISTTPLNYKTNLTVPSPDSLE